MTSIIPLNLKVSGLIYGGFYIVNVAIFVLLDLFSTSKNKGG